METRVTQDIAERFSLDQVSHHELLEIFRLRYMTCWRVSKNQITFPASHDYRLKVNVSHGLIEQIFAGKSLSDGELDELLAQVSADLKDDRIAEFGRDILFARKPVTGGFRFSSIDMQLLPAPARAPRPPQTLADNPFVLEHPIRAYRTPGLRNVRRYGSAVEWARVLNALLNTSIKHSGPRSKQFWASNVFGNLNKCFWAQEFYTFPGFHAYRSQLSRKSRSPLPVVPADAYFGPFNKLIPLLAQHNAMDNFYLPDNVDQLVAAFLSLKGEKRRRFLRSATMIYYAKELWDTSISASFLACVQAIEALTDKPSEDPCPTCGKDRTDGPTQLVKKIVQKHCKGMEVDKKVLDDLYRVRSALAHGEYLFQMDESPGSFGYVASVASDKEREMIDPAITIAKQVLRNWLLSQAV